MFTMKDLDSVLKRLGVPTPDPVSKMQPPLISPPVRRDARVKPQAVSDSYGRAYLLIPNGVKIYKDGGDKRACVTFSYRRLSEDGMTTLPRVRVSKKDRIRHRRAIAAHKELALNA